MQAAQQLAGEDLDAAAARMPANSVKGAVFEALRAAGPDGLEIGQLVDAVQVTHSLQHSACARLPACMMLLVLPDARKQLPVQLDVYCWHQMQLVAA